MTDAERLKIIDKLCDAPPGVLTAREIIHLSEMYNLRVGFDDKWLAEMNQKIMRDPSKYEVSNG